MFFCGCIIFGGMALHVTVDNFYRHYWRDPRLARAEEEAKKTLGWD